MEIRFPTDADGFLSQKCPSCNQSFKVVFGDGGNGPLAFCPYCGFEGRGCWWTKDQADYIQASVANVVVGPQLEKFYRRLKSSSRGFGKVEVKSNIPKVPPSPVDADGDFGLLRFPCCNETVKADRHDKMFCVICGKEMDLKMSDAKKVFLSHKGADKDLVIDFKETLQILGYDPWIDEDAMPAGIDLERGILQGMQDSCGVVFFITPSFKDEGYLETEVTYAILEKRKKGDKFAIIPLLIDLEGKSGQIPDLLDGYNWKKPKTRLQALREIVRALPIKADVVEWREGIEGVVVAPRIRSKSTELSNEAKSILKEAAIAADDGRDGRISYAHNLGGHSISANSKSLIPDRQSRTVELWRGGLKDLERHGFIRRVDNEGKLFEVTREGYEAADELNDAQQGEQRDVDAASHGPHLGNT